MIISKGKFLQYQRMFHQKIVNTPHTIGLEVVSLVRVPSEGEFSLDAFVGDSSRTPVIYSLQALYVRDIPMKAREKYGLPIEVNGMIFLSEIQLTNTVGSFRLDWNKVKIHFQGGVQVVQKVEYLEPLYDSCIGVQLFLKDVLKGG